MRKRAVSQRNEQAGTCDSAGILEFKELTWDYYEIRMAVKLISSLWLVTSTRSKKSYLQSWTAVSFLLATFWCPESKRMSRTAWKENKLGQVLGMYWSSNHKEGRHCIHVTSVTSRFSDQSSVSIKSKWLCWLDYSTAAPIWWQYLRGGKAGKRMACQKSLFASTERSASCKFNNAKTSNPNEYFQSFEDKRGKDLYGIIVVLRHSRWLGAAQRLSASCAFSYPLDCKQNSSP